jgi:hypothetical protein
MRYLKSYKVFESNKENEETVQEISDIFIGVKDCGLEVSDVHTGYALSMGDKEIITDHNEFSEIETGSFKSFSIRLKPIERGVFAIDNDIFEEIESSIKHVESQFNIELSSIYLRTFDGVWFNSISRMKRYIEESPLVKIRHVIYLDLTFRDLEGVNESIDDDSEVLYNLEEILQDLKDNYFDISVLQRSRKNNYCIMVGFLKDTTGGLAEEFKLSEIKEYVVRVIEYMKSNEHDIQDIGAFDLSRSVKVSFNINEWDLDTKVLGINFYFD